MNAPDIIAARPFTEAYFHDIAAVLDRTLRPGEFYTAWLAAETSDFVRFNRGKVRQPGGVSQCFLEIDLIQGRRHASQRLALGGNAASDAAAIEAVVLALRATLPALGDDPHLLYATEVHSTRSVRGAPLPAAECIIDDVLTAAEGHDIVGIYAGGPVMRGFANAAGQRNWHEATSFNLQWSLYHRSDKAVKSALSGLAWDRASFVARMEEARSQLASVALPSRSLTPGDYRVFLAPAAMEEIAGMLQWGAFSARALATRQSSLARMQGDRPLVLDDRVTVREATAQGIATGFQSAGFIRPDHVALIEKGRLVDALTSPRTALEFGGVSNGANHDETPEALSMDGGDLAASDALAALDRGLYIGNLWYLNYSDRAAARITGMTRFATFLVEHGRIVAPVDVLRFDDTLYRMFGSSLERLTRETELRLESSTYTQRALASVRVPGALLSKMTFTL